MKLVIYFSIVTAGFFLIRGGMSILKRHKDKGYEDITLTPYSFILCGIIAIILGLLGILEVVPWEK